MTEQNMKIRTIKREEIENIKNIDRSEIVNQFYYYQNGKLVLKNGYFNIRRWTPRQIKKHVKGLLSLYDRGGFFYGLLHEERMVGLISLECKFIGSANNQLQVVFLHVDKNYRKKGFGRKLMDKVKERARELGAKKLYISATPSKNTVDFYMHLGCKLAPEINPELYKLEPDDIHLEIII